MSESGGAVAGSQDHGAQCLDYLSSVDVEGGKNSMRYDMVSLMILAAGIQPALADVRKPTCDDLFSFVDAMPGMHKTFSQSELERLLGTGPLKMSVGDFDQTIGIVWNCRLLAEKSVPQDPLGAARSSKLTDLYTALMDWLNLLFWHSLHR